MIELKPALTINDLPKGQHHHIIGATPDEARERLERQGKSGTLWHYTDGRGYYVILFALHNVEEK